ncbi:uncharacterized protein [Aegilops tauschii subsp. strangulata]|uniref:uncharacterized protein n=1 Tax=Aegilops tauschii subsp. strangulata TaxID=200361 RepID=UPI001ABC23EA|nr:uncharacterized protein LOC120975403 [Aegilops tauschii subsp. strangulata]
MAGAIPDPRGYDLELRRPRLHRLQPPVRAEALHNLAIWSSSPPRPWRHRRRSPPPAPPRGSEHVHDLPRNPETSADAPMIDYIDDDPSSVSAELPDGGSLEPDATADEYYHVKTADD